tara:strand:+ start:1888 stop:2112 length:225 start_codon:yes stop_codon:yes gene_type:complete
MDNLINIIKRQTDYSEDVIVNKLKQYNNDVEKIILEYNNVELQNEDDKFKDMSTNQKIFKTIRQKLDNDRLSKK